MSSLQSSGAVSTFDVVQAELVQLKQYRITKKGELSVVEIVSLEHDIGILRAHLGVHFRRRLHRPMNWTLQALTDISASELALCDGQYLQHLLKVTTWDRRRQAFERLRPDFMQQPELSQSNLEMLRSSLRRI